MFPHNNIEFMASEHRRDLRQEAEQMRLIKSAGLQLAKQWDGAERLANWLGCHLIKWGSKLQGYKAGHLPQVISIKAISKG